MHETIIIYQILCFDIVGLDVQDPSDLSLYTMESAEKAFRFLDMNHDNKVDRKEMISTLITALSYLEFTSYDPSEETDINKYIQGLSQRITESCFAFLGLDDQLYVSLHDFTAWYLAVGEHTYRKVMIHAIQAYNLANDRQNLTEIAPLDELFNSIREMRTSLGLNYVTLKSIYDSLKSEAIVTSIHHHDVDATYHKILTISRPFYLKRFESLASVTGIHHIKSSTIQSIDSNQNYNIDKLLIMLFNCFHPDATTDTIPLSSIICGFSLFYFDQYEQSLRQLFKILADIQTKQCNIFLSDFQLRNYFYQNIKLIYLLSTNLKKYTQTDAESFTMYIYGYITHHIPRKHIGSLNQVEFIESCICGMEMIYSFINNDENVLKDYLPMQLLRSNGIPITADIADISMQRFDILSSEIFQQEQILLSMIDAKILLGLIYCSPISIFQLFRVQPIDIDGNISFTSYQCVINKLCNYLYGTLSIVDRMIADYIIDRIFEVFSYDNSESSYSGDKTHLSCDVLDITIAMITLCGGEAHLKASSITEIFRYFTNDINPSIQSHLSAINTSNNGLKSDSTSPSDRPHSSKGQSTGSINDTSQQTIAWTSANALYTSAGQDKSFNSLTGSSEDSIRMNFLDDMTIQQTTDDGSPISFDYTAMCTEPVFIAIASLNPNLSDRTIIEEISEEFTFFAFEQLFQNVEEITVTQFEDWFEILFQYFDEEYGQNQLEQMIAMIQQNRLYGEVSISVITYDMKQSLRRLYILKRGNSLETDNQEILMVQTENEDTKDISDGIVLPSSTTSILDEISYASTLLGLNGFTADDIMETLSDYSSNGEISLSQWIQVLQYIMCLGNIPLDKYQEASILANELFQAFQINENASISFASFASGLSVLSMSPTEDRLSVSFVLNDSNRDSSITIDEFIALIDSHLLVTITCSKLARMRLKDLQKKYSITTKDLANAVALECFAALKIDKSDELTLEMLCEVANDCLVLAENIAL